MKKFVRGSNEDEIKKESNLSDTERKTSPELRNGDEVRQAYEEIIGREALVSLSVRTDPVDDEELPGDEAVAEPPPADPPPSVISAGPSPSAGVSVPPTLSSLMKLAERNDHISLRVHLNQDNSLLNAVDQFGWSLLMVASCAGALQVVQLLLSLGANANLREKGGHSSCSLALKKGHVHVAQMIRNFHPTFTSKSASPARKTSHPPQRELCDACNISIDRNQKRSHLTSTVHQLSQCSRGCRTYYSIPECNRGYQMMLRSGWDKEKGLGPSGNGLKLPPKTTLKRDREGLGASKNPARITHFKSNDVKAVSGNILKRRKSKVLRKQQIVHEKSLEIALRRDLS